MLNETKIILFRMNKFKDKICLTGIEVIRNIPGFLTAVYQLIIVQIAPIPDEPIIPDDMPSETVPWYIVQSLFPPHLIKLKLKLWTLNRKKIDKKSLI